MAYTVVNFKTKKALKEAVASWNNYIALRNIARPGSLAAAFICIADVYSDFFADSAIGFNDIGLCARCAQYETENDIWP
jgi:hypothetical protein